MLPGSLSLKSSEMDWKLVKTCSLVGTSPHFSLFLGKTGFGFYVPKMKKTIQTVTKKSAKTCLCDGMGCISAHGMGDCIYVKIPLMQRLFILFWRDICCRQDDDFSQELHVHFRKTMPGLILHELQQLGFVCIDCLTGLICPDLSQIEKVCALWRGESDIGNCWKSCIHQEWAKIPIAKLHQFISSVF